MNKVHSLTITATQDEKNGADVKFEYHGQYHVLVAAIAGLLVSNDTELKKMLYDALESIDNKMITAHDVKPEPYGKTNT